VECVGCGSAAVTERSERTAQGYHDRAVTGERHLAWVEQPEKAVRMQSEGQTGNAPAKGGETGGRAQP
jgi:hypothetical protein